MNLSRPLLVHLEASLSHRIEMPEAAAKATLPYIRTIEREATTDD